MKRAIIMLALAACGDPLDWPDLAQPEPTNCVHDDQCDGMAVCFLVPGGSHGPPVRSCEIPCDEHAECVPGEACVELVGERNMRKVCR